MEKFILETLEKYPEKSMFNFLIPFSACNKDLFVHFVTEYKHLGTMFSCCKNINF